jgi:large subunit ribosomal protein L29
MKYKEIVGMGQNELKEKLDELQLELMKQNAQVATGTTPKSPGQLKQIKKTIAKIVQVMNQKNNE